MKDEINGRCVSTNSSPVHSPCQGVAVGAIDDVVQNGLMEVDLDELRRLRRYRFDPPRKTQTSATDPSLTPGLSVGRRAQEGVDATRQLALPIELEIGDPRDDERAHDGHSQDTVDDRRHAAAAVVEPTAFMKAAPSP